MTTVFDDPTGLFHDWKYDVHCLYNHHLTLKILKTGVGGEVFGNIFRLNEIKAVLREGDRECIGSPIKNAKIWLAEFCRHCNVILTS